MVSEAEAERIRHAFESGGEYSAMLQLREMFPGVSVDQAKECARTIAGWRPIVMPPPKVRRKARAAVR